jgi:hypothetical protein
MKFYSIYEHLAPPLQKDPNKQMKHVTHKENHILQNPFPHLDMYYLGVNRFIL